MAHMWRWFRGLPMWVRVLGVVLVVVVIAAASSDGEDRQPGNQDDPGTVYDRIGTSTDCAELQAEFDTAMDHAESRPAGDRDIAMSYAEAADERMAEIGCYD